MTAGEGRYSQAELTDWARGARDRSAACARVDWINEHAAERDPEPGGAGNEPAAVASTQLAVRAQLAAPVPDLAIGHDQARADGELQDQVIERIFAAALTLQDAAGLTAEPEVRWRITAAVGDLDELIRLIRGALFGSAHRPPSRAAGRGSDGQLPMT